ncbi:diguanylate cyclase [Clostridium sp. USBA 49]|uniref:diguanylate cyclase n=1 Tax=Clostridium sp. USBA 49 TaxID=1881060 RepID=UPI001FA8C991|nr:diguanylate cyclase [Clostridium sp. USBA 49]
MEKFAINNVIRIILNQNQQILHTNINWVETNSYLDKLVVLDNLADNISVQYCIENHHVVIDRFIFNNQPHYLIIIAIRNDCSSCTKVFKDEVTGLFNRNFLKHIAEDKIYYSKPAYLSLILVDIDNLKEINDTHGHLAGDKAIKIIGHAIRSCIRKGNDIAVRFGGDEFIILLSNQDRKAAEKVIRRIKEEIAKEESMNIGISVGIACNHHELNMEEIIRMADEELYKEKEIKKGQKEQNGKVSDLAKEIIKVKDELNRKVIENNKILNNTEIIEISQKLDGLIIKYLEIDND